MGIKRVNKKMCSLKKRKSNNRERNLIVFMVAEGKNKTEKQYFEDFVRDKNFRIQFVSSNETDPIKMVNSLIARMQECGFDDTLGDVAYCLIDADFDPKKENQIKIAEEKANKHKIQLIISAPCFEIWFICHFIASTRHYSSNGEVLKILQKYISNYEKSNRGIYKKTKDKLAEAIKNSKNLEHDCQRNNWLIHTVAFSPSTEVYKIAETLLNYNKNK